MNRGRGFCACANIMRRPKQHCHWCVSFCNCSVAVDIFLVVGHVSVLGCLLVIGVDVVASWFALVVAF